MLYKMLSANDRKKYGYGVGWGTSRGEYNITHVYDISKHPEILGHVRDVYLGNPGERFVFLDTGKKCSVTWEDYNKRLGSPHVRYPFCFFTPVLDCEAFFHAL